MANFVQVTSDGDLIIINVDHLISVTPNADEEEGGCIIYMTDDQSYSIEENFTAMTQLLTPTS